MECRCEKLVEVPDYTVQKAKERMKQDTILKTTRVSPKILREVTFCGFNLYYPDRVEWFDYYTETWHSEVIPKFVFYMQTVEEIYAFLHNYLGVCAAPPPFND